VRDGTSSTWIFSFVKRVANALGSSASALRKTANQDSNGKTPSFGKIIGPETGEEDAVGEEGTGLVGVEVGVGKEVGVGVAFGEDGVDWVVVGTVDVLFSFSSFSFGVVSFVGLTFCICFSSVVGIVLDAVESPIPEFDFGRLVLLLLLFIPDDDLGIPIPEFDLGTPRGCTGSS